MVFGSYLVTHTTQKNLVLTQKQAGSYEQYIDRVVSMMAVTVDSVHKGSDVILS